MHPLLTKAGGKEVSALFCSKSRGGPKCAPCNVCTHALAVDGAWWVPTGGRHWYALADTGRHWQTLVHSGTLW
jgi:hypothetical protein